MTLSLHANLNAQDALRWRVLMALTGLFMGLVVLGASGV